MADDTGKSLGKVYLDGHEKRRVGEIHSYDDEATAIQFLQDRNSFEGIKAEGAQAVGNLPEPLLKDLIVKGLQAARRDKMLADRERRTMENISKESALTVVGSEGERGVGGSWGPEDVDKLGDLTSPTIMGGLEPALSPFEEGALTPEEKAGAFRRAMDESSRAMGSVYDAQPTGNEAVKARSLTRREGASLTAAPEKTLLDPLIADDATKSVTAGTMTAIRDTLYQPVVYGGLDIPKAIVGTIYDFASFVPAAAGRVMALEMGVSKPVPENIRALGPEAEKRYQQQTADKYAGIIQQGSMMVRDALMMGSTPGAEKLAAIGMVPLYPLNMAAEHVENGIMALTGDRSLGALLGLATIMAGFKAGGIPLREAKILAKDIRTNGVVEGWKKFSRGGQVSRATPYASATERGPIASGEQITLPDGQKITVTLGEVPIRPEHMAEMEAAQREAVAGGTEVVAGRATPVGEKDYLVEMSREAADWTTPTHEAVHVLRSKFTKEEWDTLERTATQDALGAAETPEAKAALEARFNQEGRAGEQAREEAVATALQTEPRVDPQGLLAKLHERHLEAQGAPEGIIRKFTRGEVGGRVAEGGSGGGLQALKRQKVVPAPRAPEEVMAPIRVYEEKFNAAFKSKPPGVGMKPPRAPLKGGKRVGYPDRITDDKAYKRELKRLGAVFARVEAENPQHKFFWDEVGQFVRDVSGLVKNPDSTWSGNRKMADDMARAMSFYSPEVTVGQNARDFVNALYERAFGKPAPGRSKRPDATAGQLEASLALPEVDINAPGFWYKTTSMYRNIMERVLDMPDSGAVTIDRHHIPDLGFTTPNISERQYEYSVKAMTDAAALYNKTHGTNIPVYQFQAGVWAGVRPVGITGPLGGTSIPAFFTMGHVPYETIPNRLPDGKSSIPGTEWLFDAPYDLRKEYTRRTHEVVLDENGNNELLEMVRSPLAVEGDTQGVWAGDLNPGKIINAVMEETRVGAISSRSQKMLDDLANFAGYIWSQGEVGNYIVVPESRSPGERLGFSVKVDGKGLSPEHMDVFKGILDKYELGATARPEGTHVINWYQGREDWAMKAQDFGVRFIKAIAEFAESTGVTPDFREFRAPGNIFKNDWEAKGGRGDQEGGGGDAGNAFLSWIGDRYGPRGVEWANRKRADVERVAREFTVEHGPENPRGAGYQTLPKVDQDLVNKLVDGLGVTEDWGEAGYVLQDGRMINIRGGDVLFWHKKALASIGIKDMTPAQVGERAGAHRVYYFRNTYPTAQGNRVSEDLNIEFFVAPSKQALDRIRGRIGQDTVVNIDITDPVTGKVVDGAMGIGFESRQTLNDLMARAYPDMYGKEKSAPTPPTGFPHKYNAWEYDGSYGSDVHQYTNRDPRDPLFRNTIAVKSPEQFQPKIDALAKKYGVPAYQTARTDTPEFKKWFKGSSVKGEKGKPLQVYHATDADFSKFNVNISDLGAHFGTQEQSNAAGKVSETLAQSIQKGIIKYPVRTVPVFLNIKKPLRLVDYGGFSVDQVLPQLRDMNIISAARSSEINRERTNSKADAAIRKEIERAGYDGVVYLNRREAVNWGDKFMDPSSMNRLTDAEVKDLYPGAADSYIAFRPEQIKSQFNRGTWDKKTGNIMHQTTRTPNWFSQAQRVVEETFPDSIKGASALNLLQKFGVKKAEIEDLKLLDFVKGKDRVTKQELSDYIEVNSIKVKEVVKGGNLPAPTESWSMEASRIIQGSDGKFTALIDDDLIGIYDTHHLASNAIYNALHPQPGKMSPTKFSQWQTPGGENYRELLLTVPVSERDAEVSHLVKLANSLPEGNPDRDEAITRLDRMNRERGGTPYKAAPRDSFTSPHWDEPNVLAHIRFNDRTGPGGKKLLHVEEYQSDWDAKVRENKGAGESGYSVEQMSEAPEGTDWFVYDSLGQEVAGPFKTPGEGNEWVKKTGPDVPPMPFSGGWKELVAKRMLLYAAEKGYDAVSWTTGEQQAARYDLSKQVEAIGLTKRNNGTIDVQIKPLGADEWDNLGTKRPEELPAVIGKDQAAKAMKDIEADGYSKLSGPDLKVGGEWAKTLYDQKFVSIFNKLGKKYGAKVGETAFESSLVAGEGTTFINNEGGRFAVYDAAYPGRGAMGRFNTHAEAVAFNVSLDASRATKTVHHLPLTPAMRADLMNKGLPMYQAVGAGRVPGYPNGKGHTPNFSTDDANRMATAIILERWKDWELTQTHEETKSFAAALIDSPEKLQDFAARFMARDSHTSFPTAEYGYAGRMIADGIERDAVEALSKFRRGEASFEEFATWAGLTAEMLGKVVKGTSATFRTGEAAKIPVETSAGLVPPEYYKEAFGVYRATVENLKNITTKPDGSLDMDAVNDIVTKFDALGERKADLIRKLPRASTKDLFFEYWYFSLLSGPRTHIVNLIDTAVQGLWGVPERGVAGLVSAITGNEGVAPAEALALSYGFYKGFNDSVLMAYTALTTGATRFGEGKFDVKKAWTAEGFGLDPQTSWGKAIDLLGGVFRSVGRSLLTADEFNKSMAYHGELYAQSYRKAYYEGKKGLDFQRRLEDLQDPANQEVWSQIDKGAKEYAREMTYTDTENMTKVGKWAMRGRESIPVRIILPFVSIADRIAAGTVSRLGPASFLLEKTRNDLGAGGAKRDLAIAKLTLGGAMMGMFTMWAAEGIITGSGPRDQREKQSWLDTGWKPNSIRIGKTYYGYDRFGVFGTMLQMAANTYDYWDEIPSGRVDSFIAAQVLGFVDSMSEKYFLKGIGDIVTTVRDAARDPDNVKPEKYFRRLSTSLVPNFIKQVEQTIDPRILDRQTWSDELKSAFPFLSEDVGGKFNMWDEDIVREQYGYGIDLFLPIQKSTKKDNLVRDEIVKNKIVLGMPPRVLAGRMPPQGSLQMQEPSPMEGVQLSREEYRTFVRLAAGKPAMVGDKEVRVAPDALEDSLIRIINSPAYEGATEGRHGTKADLIRNEVYRYREMAKKVMESTPDTRNKIMEKKVIRRNLKLPERLRISPERFGIGR